LLDCFSENYLKSYFKSSKEQAIDENMVKFKVKILFRQYCPMKSIKRDFKIWVRADKYGFFCQFQIYVGKIDVVAEKNLDERVVKDLTRD